MEKAKTKIQWTADNVTRLCIFSALQLFNVVSLVYFFVAFLMGNATVTQPIMCFMSILYVAVTDVAQKLFKFRTPLPVYIFALVYAFCPMLGHTYGLYYYISWWDKMLHVAGGVVFALFGAYLPKVFLKTNDVPVWLCIVSGFMFSLGISVLWEYVEFFLDTVCGTDMQKDSIITNIRSYLLQEELFHVKGELLDIGTIQQTVIVTDKGTYTIEGGYLDFGRMDTMLDMLVEGLGALVYSVIYLFDKGKHTAFTYLPKKETPVLETAETVETEEVLQEAAVAIADETPVLEVATQNEQEKTE